MSVMAPPMAVLQRIEQLAPGFWADWQRAVQAAWQRADGPMQVTSWWRSVQHNAEVGGSDNSQHLVGVAFDVVPVVQRNASALAAVGFRVINEGDHLHAQPWPAGVVSFELLRWLGLA